MRVRTLSNPLHLAMTLAIGFALAASLVLGSGPVRAVATGQKVVVIVGPVGGGSIQTNYLSKGEAIAVAAEALRRDRCPRLLAERDLRERPGGGQRREHHRLHRPRQRVPESLQRHPADGMEQRLGPERDRRDGCLRPNGHGHASGLTSVDGATAARPRSRASPSPAPCRPASGAPAAASPRPPASSWSSRTPATHLARARPRRSPSPARRSARQRVEYYSRPFLALGGTYFASDIGSKSVVETILENPNTGFGDIYAMGNGYSQAAQVHFPHSLSSR